MKISKTKFMLLLLMASGVANAQEIKPMTLQEAVQKSITVSKTLQIENTGVEIAKNRVQNVKDARLPDVSASGQMMYLPFNPSVDFKIPLGSSSSSSTSGSTTGSSSASSSPSPKTIVYGTLGASLPIFTGFRLKNNLLNAQYGVQLSELSATLQKENSVWQIVNLYYSLYKTNAAIGALKENLVRSENRIKDFQNFVNNGILPENDLLKAKLQKTNLELSMEDLKNTAENIKFKINTLLQQDVSTPISTDETPFVLPNANDLINTSNRTDLGILAKKAETSKIGIELAKASYYPTVALSASYMALNIDKIVAVTNAFNLGIALKYNIASLYKNNSEVKVAKLQSLQAEQRIAEATDKAKIEINEANKNYEMVIKKQRLYQESLVQANENLRIVTNKNKNGLADTDQLLEADVQQLQAVINEKTGKIDQLAAYLQVLYHSGTLLDYLHIQK